MMVWKRDKLQSDKIEGFCLMFNCAQILNLIKYYSMNVVARFI
jgi:hypothetical protein